jgi:hypothetical protein
MRTDSKSREIKTSAHLKIFRQAEPICVGAFIVENSALPYGSAVNVGNAVSQNPKPRGFGERRIPAQVRQQFASDKLFLYIAR